MNRRAVLKAMLTVPAMSALSACKDNDKPPAAREGTLKVILHGPFAVVLDTRNRHRVKAFVPFDADFRHEFRFPTPMDRVSDEGKPGNRIRYQFSLSDEDLLIGERPRHIDRGFDDFTLHTGAWEPKPDDYFVSLDLPTPDIITFIPPSVPVLLAGSKLSLLPVDHVLEYRIRDFSSLAKIRLRSKQLGDHAPLSCSELMGKYREHWKNMDKDKRSQNPRQRKDIESEFNACQESAMAWFFLGVGLPPSPFDDKDAAEHGKAFFNKVLLGSFPNAPDVERRRLDAVDVKACSTTGDVRPSAQVIPAVQASEAPEPRLRLVSSTEDCRVGGVIGLLP